MKSKRTFTSARNKIQKDTCALRMQEFKVRLNRKLSQSRMRCERVAEIKLLLTRPENPM